MKQLHLVHTTILSAVAVAAMIGVGELYSTRPADAEELSLSGRRNDGGTAGGVYVESTVSPRMTYESEDPGEIDEEDPLP